MRKSVAVLLTLAVLVALGLVGPPAVAAAHHDLVVRLVTSAGVRIPDVTVRLDGAKDYAKHTDARGVARFPNVLEGRYRVKATVTDKAKEAHAGSSTVVVDRTRVGQVEVAGLTGVRGVVTKGSTPVPGAHVWVASVGHREGARAVTAADGSYSVVGMRPGKVTVIVYRGFTSNYFTTYYGNTVRQPDARVVTLATDVAKVADVSVKRSATITGRVVNSHGTPMADVEVNSSTEGNLPARTNAAGVYYLHGMEAGKTKVWVSRGRDVPTRSATSVVAELGRTTTAPTIVAKIGTASITVTQKRPYWYFGPSATLYSSSGAWIATTDGCVYDDDGDCRTTNHLSFTGLRAGTYTLSLDGSNVGRTVTLRAGQHVDLGALSVPATTTLSGTVTDGAMKPIAGMPIELQDQWGTEVAGARTDASGHYAIKGLVAGRYRLVSYALGSFAPTSTTVTAVRGKDATASLVVPAGASVSGVVTHAGKPVAGITVNIRPSTAPRFSDFVRTDSKGRYSFSQLTPGPTTVWADDEEYRGGYARTQTTVHTAPGEHVAAPDLLVHY